MKKILSSLLLLAGSGGLMVWAQANAPAAKPKEEAQAEITSGQAYYDGAKDQMIYSSHVLVVYPQIRLTCERLTIDLPPEGQPTNIVAVTNVVVHYVEKGKTSLITADKAIYDYHVVNGVTNELLTFTGHAEFENENVFQTGEPIIYNCLTHDVSIPTNPVTRPRHIPNSRNSTNSMPFNFLK